MSLTKLRRLINEPTDVTYSDAILSEALAEQSDIYAVAADIWLEKAAAVISFDFSADGATFSKSQLHKQYLEQRDLCLSKVKGTIVKVVPKPTPKDYQVIINN